MLSFIFHAIYKSLIIFFPSATNEQKNDLKSVKTSAGINSLIESYLDSYTQALMGIFYLLSLNKQQGTILI